MSLDKRPVGGGSIPELAEELALLTTQVRLSVCTERTKVRETALIRRSNLVSRTQAVGRRLVILRFVQAESHRIGVVATGNAALRGSTHTVRRGSLSAFRRNYNHDVSPLKCSAERRPCQLSTSLSQGPPRYRRRARRHRRKSSIRKFRDQQGKVSDIRDLANGVTSREQAKLLAAVPFVRVSDMQ